MLQMLTRPSLPPQRFQGSLQITPLTNPAQRAFSMRKLQENLGILAKQYGVTIHLQRDTLTEKTETLVFQPQQPNTVHPANTLTYEPTTYVDVISPNKRKEKAADNAVLRLFKKLLPDIELPKALKQQAISWHDSDISFQYQPQTQSSSGYGDAPAKRWQVRSTD